MALQGVQGMSFNVVCRSVVGGKMLPISSPSYSRWLSDCTPTTCTHAHHYPHAARILRDGEDAADAIHAGVAAEAAEVA